VAEAGGKQYAEPPKGRKRRKTIYPRLTPSGPSDPAHARGRAGRLR
jgi:hypothetical protein